MRARAMVLVYASAFVVSIVMAGHDLFIGAHEIGLHLLNEAAMALLQVLGIYLVLQRRLDQAGAIILPVVGIFTAASLTDVVSGNPAGFYDGWARWYPAFIVAAMLFASPLVAGILAAWSVAWNGLYYLLFCNDLPEPLRSQVLGEVWEVSAVDGLVGALAVAGMSMVRASSRTALEELERNRTLNAELEARVHDRTQALASRLAERHAILQHLGDGLLVADASGERVELVNPALLALYGLETVEMGVPVAEVFPQDLTTAIREACVPGTDMVEREITLPGERLGMVVANGFAEAGVRIGMVAVVRDTTLSREVDRMKTEFISMASHELRTPLTSVFGFARIIESKLRRTLLPALPDDPKVQKAARVVQGNVKIIVSEGERLTDLVNDILDISKMEAGKMEYRRDPVDIAELCARSAHAVASLFEGGEVPLMLEVDEGLPAVTGDEHRLIQVLVNLLSNARKFTDAGRVTLTARAVEGGVELAVADTGAGIAPEDVEVVFERFRQVGGVLTDKPRGTGLGLAICRQIVDAHDGDLQLTSTLGEGSRFFFVLPAS